MITKLVKRYLWWPTKVSMSGGHTRWMWLTYAWRVMIQNGQVRYSPWLDNERLGAGYLVHIRLKLRREAQRQ